LDDELKNNYKKMVHVKNVSSLEIIAHVILSIFNKISKIGLVERPNSSAMLVGSRGKDFGALFGFDNFLVLINMLLIYAVWNWEIVIVSF
jgi:hypothetical protein